MMIPFYVPTSTTTFLQYKWYEGISFVFTFTFSSKTVWPPNLFFGHTLFLKVKSLKVKMAFSVWCFHFMFLQPRSFNKNGMKEFRLLYFQNCATTPNQFFWPHPISSGEIPKNEFFSMMLPFYVHTTTFLEYKSQMVWRNFVYLYFQNYATTPNRFFGHTLFFTDEIPKNDFFSMILPFYVLETMIPYYRNGMKPLFWVSKLYDHIKPS